MGEAIRFRIEGVDGAARAGRLWTHHGEVDTPFFMPVATAAAIKGVTPGQLRACGARVVLANTYHLALRPGEALVQDFGGVAAFMGWHGPMLTDSGGFQVYSLAEIRKLDDDGVTFRSHIDGATFHLTPERAVQIQQDLGPDMFMALDECPPGGADRDAIARSLARTHAWAARCKAAWRNRERQALFGIVQGGVHDDLRRESAAAIAALDLPGNAIGGVSVGEAPEEVERVTALTAALLPASKPRYLMGVGRPQDILRAVGHGVDMFDCVMPTRHARHGQAFTRDGPMNLKNARWRDDRRPIDEDCRCATCQSVSRGYLRHLLQAGEMLGLIDIAIHNLYFYLEMLRMARCAIQEGRFASFQRTWLDRLDSDRHRGR